jgi:general stress protein 26
MGSSSNIRTFVVAAVAAVAAFGVVGSPLRAEVSKRDMDALAKAKLIYIATVRKSGMQSTSAPVWFTMGADSNSILIQTGPKTWKAKRIKRGSPVLVWIGEKNGPAFIGKAEITSDPAIVNKILDDFHKKYWENRIMGVGPSKARFDSGERIAIKITPVRDLPEGFQSQPGSPPPALETPAATSSPAH